MEEKTSGKKSNLAVILIVVGVVLVVLAVGGFFAGRHLWQNFQSDIETTPSAKAADEEGRGGGGGSATPTPSASGPVGWPTDLPANLIPQYTGGTVANAGKTENPGSFSIQITGSTQAEFDAYKNLLLSQGWTITNPNDFRANNYSLAKAGAGWDLGILYNNNGVLITLMEEV